MALTPRKEERAALIELLEAEWDTPDALASALLKESFRLLQERDLWGLAVDHAGLRVVYGPFATEGDVERAHKALGVGVGYVGKMYAAAGVLRQDVEPLLGLCAACAHPKGVHDHPKAWGRCMAGTTQKENPACPCKQYVK